MVVDVILADLIHKIRTWQGLLFRFIKCHLERNTTIRDKFTNTITTMTFLLDWVNINELIFFSKQLAISITMNRSYSSIHGICIHMSIEHFLAKHAFNSISPSKG